ncbi:major capsid protein [Ruixingdingia sedimenti]|uniref:Major capsid protein n=1 Tax=Ruixingdingia sedimenti TaxID=3073604 RepID=A0ABU1FDA0_9RHOB|nr:major capsid protein [Xinfangfangia sp. LG-4]MDR5654874.1 major capsid protein [Xinfangfangia sp. LG-4]
MAGIVDFLTQDTVDGTLVATMAGVIQKDPLVPSQTQEMGLYSAEPIMGTTVKTELQGSTIQLVQTSPRTTDAPTKAKSTRDIVHFEAVRVALAKTFTSDEVLNLRQIGTNGDFMTLENYVAQESRDVRASVQATLEAHRVGGLRGYVLDADGDVITDMWTKYGVTQADEVGFELDAAAGAVPDPIRRKLANITRAQRNALGARAAGGVRTVGLAGAGFFDAFVGCREVRETYLNQVGASELRSANALTGRAVQYGTATIYEYDGFIGNTPFVEDDEVRFFVAGVPGLFRQFFAPHDRDPAMYPGKTIGQPEYVLPFIDPKGRFREIEFQSNPVTICTVPATLIGGRAGAVTP